MKFYKCNNCGNSQVETEFGECAECGYENLVEITETEYNKEIDRKKKTAFVTVKHINVYQVPNETFLYYVKDKNNYFDIRTLKNWGYNPKTKMAKDSILHFNVIREAIHHGWINEYLQQNDIAVLETSI